MTSKNLKFSDMIAYRNNINLVKINKNTQFFYFVPEYNKNQCLIVHPIQSRLRIRDFYAACARLKSNTPTKSALVAIYTDFFTHS